MIKKINIIVNNNIKFTKYSVEYIIEKDFDINIVSVLKNENKIEFSKLSLDNQLEIINNIAEYEERDRAIY